MAPASARLSPQTGSLYELDFHRWAQDQASALRDGRIADLDWENLAEEIESLGRNDKRAIESHLEVLIAHLVKCVVQPERRTRSWDQTITAQRGDIAQLIKRNPSLRRLLAEHLEGEAFLSALSLVARDTGLDEHELPTTCPFDLAQIVDPDFFPN